ncbi:MAG: mechanosensitive ion channel domain-containing protein [Bacteroidota bacterium]
MSKSGPTFISSLKKYLFPLIFFLAGIGIKLLISESSFELEGMLIALPKFSSILIIIGLAWASIATLRVIKLVLMSRFDTNLADNLTSRKVYTQFNILERILVITIFVTAIASALMLFEEVRRIGVSLFASAGIAGIIIGLAAQKVIGSILAGLQIAIAQPIRLDDVVIVEGEWGRIEEINLTFVVIKIWDRRRLVVPSTYFMEKPFQNWTRTNAAIDGVVFLHTDYFVPFEALRAELDRLLESTSLWDGNTKVIHVTNATEKGVEIRIMVSAVDAGTAWELRTFIREKMVEFLRTHYPKSLPRIRAEFPGHEEP